MDALYETWVQRWQATLDACRRKGGEADELVIMPPATPEAVAAVEAEIGQVLPSQFRKTLLEFSAHVEMYWGLEADWNFGLNDIESTSEHLFYYRGACVWDIDALPLWESWRKEAEDDSYDPNGTFIFDEKWRNKLALYSVANGDKLAFDLAYGDDAPVVYLSHEDGKGHGYRLGDNFFDFMDRWSLLGCPGPEDWEMMPFLPDATSGLNTTGENARKWREWFGLDFEVK